MVRWCSAFAVLCACGGGDVTEPAVQTPSPASVTQAAPAKPAAKRKTPSQASSTVASFGGSAVDVQLSWSGIGALHKGFFSSPPQLKSLSDALTKARVVSPATVQIAFDSRWHVGQIQLVASPSGPLGRIPANEQGIRLQDLAAITEPLAQYRSKVAGRFDLRIDSFHVGVVAHSTGGVCTFGVDGPHPPDGRVISPCVDVDGVKHCGRMSDGWVQFDPPIREQILACVQPSPSAP